MRAADVAECQAAGRPDLAQMLREAVDLSAWSVAARVDGELAAIFGVRPVDGLMGQRGVPWLLGTETLVRHRRSFVRLAPAYIAQMLKAYPLLTNSVHAENTQAVAWLKRAGFRLGDAAPCGPHGAPFHPFTLEA